MTDFQASSGADSSEPVSYDLPPTPESAAELFHVKQLPVIERYAELLASEGVVRGLIGPREVPRLWDRHVLNCALMASVLVGGDRLADIGSGAGLPGLVLAIARPDVEVTLIEPLLRRTTFLSEVVDELALANVEVYRGRADDLHGKRTFSAVTSRAVAPLPRLLGWSMPLVERDGRLIALKGSNVGEELIETTAVLDRAGCTAEVLELGGVEGLSATYVLRVAWGPRGPVSWASVDSPVRTARGSSPRGRRANRGGTSRHR